MPQVARMHSPAADLDDLDFPRPKSSRGVVKWLVAATVIIAGMLGRQWLASRPEPKPTVSVPQPPSEASSVTAEPAQPPAPTPEPVPLTETAPAAAQEPSPRELAKARRSAARAAIVAERWRERRAARLARQNESDSDNYSPSSRASNSSTTSARSESTRERPSSLASADKTGVLRINSRPWSQVYVDGKWVGHTPQMNLTLPAGKHQVKLVSEEMGLSKSLSVTIVAGETLTKTQNLDN